MYVPMQPEGVYLAMGLSCRSVVMALLRALFRIRTPLAPA